MDKATESNEKHKLISKPTVALEELPKGYTPLLQQVKSRRETEAKNYRYLRFIVIASIVMVALFLLTYSGYLIAVQYLTNNANKHNMNLFRHSKIFFEIDVTDYSFNATCAFQIHSIDCLHQNLVTIRRHGVTVLVLKGVLGSDYELSERFGDSESFKTLLKTADEIGLEVYIDVKRETRNIIIQRDVNDADNTGPKKNGLSFIVSENNTCLDSYKLDVLAIIEKYAAFGVDGFVLNDLPCCVVFPQYFTGENCSFNSIYSMKKLARKCGKPSAIIYRPKLTTYGQLMKELSRFNFTFFDGIIRYIRLTPSGNIEVPKVSQIKSSAFPHEIWTLVPENKNMASFTPYLYLVQTVVAFFKGSALLSGGYVYYESDQFTKQDLSSKNFLADLNQTAFLAELKNIAKNSSCINQDSSFVPEYSDDGIFLAVSKLNSEQYSHCVLIVNMGDSRTDVNMRAHFDDMDSQFVNAIPILIVHPGSLEEPKKENPKQVITVEPKTGMLLKIKRGSNS